MKRSPGVFDCAAWRYHVAMGKSICPLVLTLVVAMWARSVGAQQASQPMEVAQPAPVSVEPKPLPMLPAELPPAAPRVSCEEGQLSISANNATLGSILTAVHNCIGVKIDFPDDAAAMRTYGEFGPGPAGQVLIALLGSTDFDYIVGASDANPQKLQTVLLMARSKKEASESTSSMVMTPARRAWLERRRASRPGQEPNSDDSSQSETEPAAAAPDQSAAAESPQPAAATDQPQPDNPPATPAMGSTLQPANTVLGSGDASSNPAQGKSTQELITDMQQMFEQRKQLNQNQNGNQAPAAPKP